MFIVAGKRNDEYGRCDMKIDSLQRRAIGFDTPEQYAVMCCEGIDLTGCLKFH